MSYLTNNEIHVLGVQRTGQHGVTSWILGHFHQACFKNNMVPIRDPRSSNRGINPPFWYFKPSESTSGSWEVDTSDLIRHDQNAIILGTEFMRTNLGIHPQVEKQRLTMAEETGNDEFSRFRHQVVVIRSPYNHYSSVLNWHRNKLLKNPNRFIACWKMMAKEAVGETNAITDPKVFILYDKWFSDKGYRQDISKQLGLEFTDRWVNVVMRIGVGRKFGSSFDTMNYKTEAQKMEVLDRWKSYKDNDLFKEVMRDEELRELSEKLFGAIPV